jgi:enamine deaminase RidA (YjgF/YER057c/UK114 family)
MIFMPTQTANLADFIQRLDVGPRMSMGVRHRDTVYFAVTPQAPYDAALSAGEQCRQLLGKAQGRLDALGSSRSRLLFVAIILADMGDFDAVNAVWDGWIDPAAPPARACFQAGMTQASLKLEMIMIAAANEAGAA